VSTCFFGSDHNERISGSFRIIVKFLINENLKRAEIFVKLRAQFDDETLSRTQVYNWSKSFKEGRAEIENVRRLHLPQEKLRPACFGTLSAFLVIDFRIEQRTINSAYYSKLLRDRVKPVFRSKRRGRSVKSFCLPHDNARPHTAAVTARNTGGNTTPRQ
jgi:hypothetical protein